MPYRGDDAAPGGGDGRLTEAGAGNRPSPAPGGAYFTRVARDGSALPWGAAEALHRQTVRLGVGAAQKGPHASPGDALDGLDESLTLSSARRL